MFLEIPYLLPIVEVVVALIVAVILERLVAIGSMGKTVNLKVKKRTTPHLSEGSKAKIIKSEPEPS